MRRVVYSAPCEGGPAATASTSIPAWIGLVLGAPATHPSATNDFAGERSVTNDSGDSKINRRQLLAAAGVPVAAAMVPSTLVAQERRSARAGTPKRIRVGII